MTDTNTDLPRHLVIGRDPHRFACPRGHVSFKTRPTFEMERRYYCRRCNRAGYDGYYGPNDLVDRKAEAQDDDGTWNGPQGADE